MVVDPFFIQGRDRAFLNMARHLMFRNFEQIPDQSGVDDGAITIELNKSCANFKIAGFIHDTFPEHQDI